MAQPWKSGGPVVGRDPPNEIKWMEYLDHRGTYDYEDNSTQIKCEGCRCGESGHAGEVFEVSEEQISACARWANVELTEIKYVFFRRRPGVKTHEAYNVSNFR